MEPQGNGVKGLFKRLSIKTKLILAIFSAATLVSMSGFLFVVAVERVDARNETIELARSQVSVLSQDFVKIQLFSDVYLAADVVAKLRAFPLIYNLFLYDKDGNVAFRYENAPSWAMSPPPLRIGEPALVSDGFLEMFLPVEYAGGRYGHVFVRVSTEKLNAKLLEYYKVVGAVVPILLLVSYLLALWLQRFFSQPIVDLARRVNRIADQHDFDARLWSDDPNEVGSLYRSFDQLLQATRRSQQRLQQGEARLAAIIDIAGSGLISIDERQRVILFNRQAERIFGYAAHEIIGQPLLVLLPERFRAHHNELVEGFAKGDEVIRAPISRPDLWGLRKNGEEFPMEATISHVVISENGGAEEGGEEHKIFTIALNDISHRRQTEQELEAYRAHLEDIVEARTSELRAKNRELEAFSYSIAHDLRAPLRIITSYSQILLEDAGTKLTPDEAGHLQRVVRSGLHLSKLIDDILDLARIGRSQMVATDVDLSQIAERIKARYQQQHPERVVNWEIQPGVSIRADPQLLEVVMENLLGNAWKYTRDRDPAQIAFGAFRQGERMVYFVRDNGAGFDMKYVNKLFGVFQRLHGTSEFEGTGIGLATVHRILQRHGGTVWAEAAVDQGATFFFSLS